jgi:serine/threonine protein phosphatase PrpC
MTGYGTEPTDAMQHKNGLLPEYKRTLEAMYETGGRPGMGTTIVGTLLSDRKAFVFNIGHSRAYAFRWGVFFQLTHDDA